MRSTDCGKRPWYLMRKRERGLKVHAICVPAEAWNTSALATVARLLVNPLLERQRLHHFEKRDPMPRRYREGQEFVLSSCQYRYQSVDGTSSDGYGERQSD